MDGLALPSHADLHQLLVWPVLPMVLEVDVLHPASPFLTGPVKAALMSLFSMTANASKGFRAKKYLSGCSVLVFSGFSSEILQTPE